jgi:hypothetical protein
MVGYRNLKYKCPCGKCSKLYKMGTLEAFLKLNPDHGVFDKEALQNSARAVRLEREKIDKENSMLFAEEAVAAEREGRKRGGDGDDGKGRNLKVTRVGEDGHNGSGKGNGEEGDADMGDDEEDNIDWERSDLRREPDSREGSEYGDKNRSRGRGEGRDRERERNYEGSSRGWKRDDRNGGRNSYPDRGVDHNDVRVRGYDRESRERRRGRSLSPEKDRTRACEEGVERRGRGNVRGSSGSDRRKSRRRGDAFGRDRGISSSNNFDGRRSSNDFDGRRSSNDFDVRRSSRSGHHFEERWDT